MSDSRRNKVAHRRQKSVEVTNLSVRTAFTKHTFVRGRPDPLYVFHVRHGSDVLQDRPAPTQYREQPA